MKLSKLLDDNFNKAMKKLNEQSLPLKTAFLLKGLNRQMQEELTKYEETRKEALTKYGEKDAEGNLLVTDNGQVTLKPETRDLFIKELNDLLNIEIEIMPISVVDLGDAKLSVDDLVALDGFIY